MSEVDLSGLYQGYDDETEMGMTIEVKKVSSHKECSLCGLKTRYRLDHLAPGPDNVTWHEFLCKNCTAGALTEYTKN